MAYQPAAAGQYKTTPPTLTDGQYSPIMLDVNGNEKVAVQGTVPVSIATAPVLVAGSAIIGKVGIDQTTPGTTNKVSIGTDGTVAVSGSVAVTGTFWQVTQPVSIAAAVTVNNAVATNLKVDPSGVTSPVSLTTLPALAAGAAIIGKVTTDQTTHGTTDLVAADITKVGGTAVSLGQKNMSASFPVTVASDNTVKTSVTPITSGGCSTYSGSVGATATLVKSSAGQLYGMVIGNSNTTVVYVQVFDVNSAGNVTLGTTSPKLSFFVPVGGGLCRDFSSGVVFNNGIVFACTTTRTGSTAPTNTVDINFDYM